VIDGDTFRFVAACGSAADCPDGAECADGTCTSEETIRLLGINAGEIPKQGSSDHHCLGDAAKSRLEALIGGQDVRLEFDPVAGCTGLYDRRLAYVFAGDRLAQTGLLTDGLACTFWFTNEDDKESMRYYTAMADAEDAARSVGVGIYSPTTSICGGLPIHPDCD
jgi:endonuclease YncB( thermonuclease family)